YVRGNSRFARKTGGSNYIELGYSDGVNKIISDDEETNQKDLVIEVASPDESYEGTNWNRSFSIATGRKGNLKKRLIITGETGYVGIGSGIPSEKLDVQGNLKASGSAKFGSANPEGAVITANYDWDKGDIIKLTRGSLTTLTLGNGGGTYSHGLIQFFARDQEDPTINLSASPSVDSYINTKNFGIGTTNPAEKLEVVGNIKASGSAQFSGRVSIGEGPTYPYAQLDVTGRYSTLYYGAQLHLHSDQNETGMFFGSYGNELGMISVGGHYDVSGKYRALSNNFSNIYLYEKQINFRINTNLSTGSSFTPTTRFKVSDTEVRSYTNLNVEGDIKASGAATITGSLTAEGFLFSPALFQISDLRSKEAVTSMDSVLDKVMQMNPIQYCYKSDKKEKQKHLGFGAQEVKNLFPELVYFSEEKDAYSLNYNNMTAVNTAAIQESNIRFHQKFYQQQQCIEKQKEELQKQKEELQALKKVVKELTTPTLEKVSRIWRSRKREE
ncbi:tail fiber domain-containing protein, partial [Xanthovirga aplysinae]|uniref:tail fiber domain-containing protein n=1 Tax=Xanthovirga aplysinae TaxID=2529853 RepID=UPI0012BCCB90